MWWRLFFESGVLFANKPAVMSQGVKGKHRKGRAVFKTGRVIGGGSKRGVRVWRGGLVERGGRHGGRRGDGREPGGILGQPRP